MDRIGGYEYQKNTPKNDNIYRNTYHCGQKGCQQKMRFSVYENEIIEREPHSNTCVNFQLNQLTR